jgi:DNA-binding transcriptional LysR family regulator
MTFRQVESFLAVAREGSFSRGAQRIHLSQPTLSGHIGELERELGAKLFVRKARQVLLTEAGRIFEGHATRMVTAAEDARRAVSDVDGLRRGSLLVGASTTPGIYVLPAVLSAFQARYPGIDIALQIANSRVIEERVRADGLDLGVVGGHVLGPGERCVAAGLLDELVLITPRGHPWARRGRTSGRELAAERMLVREPGSATRQVIERALMQAAITPARTMELGHTEAIKQCVMAGLGVAFVSIHAIRIEARARQLAIVPVRGLRVRRHFHVIHGEQRILGASAQAFLSILNEHAHRRVAPSLRGKASLGGR